VHIVRCDRALNGRGDIDSKVGLGVPRKKMDHLSRASFEGTLRGGDMGRPGTVRNCEGLAISLDDAEVSRMEMWELRTLAHFGGVNAVNGGVKSINGRVHAVKGDSLVT